MEAIKVHDGSRDITGYFDEIIHLTNGSTKSPTIKEMYKKTNLILHPSLLLLIALQY